MAQNPPIVSIATSSLVGGGVAGTYMHHTWEVLLPAVALSVAMMLVGHVRLVRGQHVLAKQRLRREDKPD